jgi:hypothetical protein
VCDFATPIRASIRKTKDDAKPQAAVITLQAATHKAKMRGRFPASTDRATGTLAMT